MLTGFLTTGDFVRLTNRSPFPSLMSFEHFTTIWPAVLEPQREWSMMETPYKKKINQTHLNSNIVREWTLLWMRNAKDNKFDTEGSWWTYIMSFYGGKNYSPFHFPPLCDNKTVNSSSFAFLLFPFLPIWVCCASFHSVCGLLDERQCIFKLTKASSEGRGHLPFGYCCKRTHTHALQKPLSYIRFIFGAIAQLKLDSFDNFKITAVLIDDKNLRTATFINMRKCGGGFSSYLSTPGGI